MGFRLFARKGPIPRRRFRGNERENQASRANLLTDSFHSAYAKNRFDERATPRRLPHQEGTQILLGSFPSDFLRHPCGNNVLVRHTFLRAQTARRDAFSPVPCDRCQLADYSHNAVR